MIIFASTFKLSMLDGLKVISTFPKKKNLTVSKERIFDLARVQHLPKFIFFHN